MRKPNPRQAVYSVLNDPKDPTLPKHLQLGKTHEANLSSQSGVFKVEKFARYGPEQSGCLKSHSAPFRLFHSQSGGFIHASCDPDKDRKYPEGRNGGGPAHIP